MRGNSFYFYATIIDWKKILEIVENEILIKYIEFGHYNSKSDIIEYNSLLNYKNLGNSVSLTTIEKNFVVLMKDNNKYAEYREVPKTYYVGSQIYCKDCIALSPGGIYNDESFVQGKIDTISKSEISQKLFKEFKTAFKKTCRNWHGTFIGKDAETYYPRLKFPPYTGINIMEKRTK